VDSPPAPQLYPVQRPAWKLVAILALLLAAVASDLQADRWYVHYDNAEQALAQEKWSTAVEEILLALERKGDSGTRVRTYGMRVVDYLPYLKLGIAYYHLEQFSAALEAFDTEERLGVIESAPAALSELNHYRQLARQGSDQGAAGRELRRQAALTESLEKARRLEAQGLLDEAMSALAVGLAVDPEHPEAVALMADLRSRVVALEGRRRAERQAQSTLTEARELLERGDAQAAAGLLRRLLDEGDNPAAQRLFAQAQQQIVASVQAAERERQIATALDTAKRAWAAGEVTTTLDSLERVLALEPENETALALRQQAATARRETEHQSLVDSTLDEANAHFEARRFEAALGAANRVLALERGHPGALEIIRRAYGELSRRLLAPAAENIPPAIRFADFRQDLAGVRAQRVRSPHFFLSGVVIDRSPAAITLLDSEGRPVEASSTRQPVGELVITEFRARPRLTPGTTVFTLVATDDDGLTSRGEYWVVYLRPWFRAPWFFALCVLVPALGTGGFLARRARRRRHRLTRGFNPYLAGGPVFDEALFFGREPLIQRILQTIHNNSLLLHGERRIGKTSLLHQLRRRLQALDDPAYEFFPVYVDLQGTPEESFFATLADQMFDSLPPEVVGTGRVPALGRAGGYGHHDLVRELHGLIRGLRALSAKRVKLVLLIDEVDELNDYDPRVNQKLRSLFMKRFAESLVAVVAGVKIRKEWEKEGSPWYNFFEELEVTPISPRDAQALVTGPIRGVFGVERGVAERIAEITGGKPYLIQRYCLTLVQLLHEQGRRTIRLADVDAIETRVGS
jgi:tetratricopeptide (TPR) repeat protein